MIVCPSCAEENPDRARFCLACGAALAAEAPAREERKVVTVLFADLVGFTSRSERMDVEDVRGTLVPYHRLLRRELERHGGTVEKFIGDAVMALFGAPVAHEDDPQRAVLAALAIQSAVARQRSEAGLDLHVRIGIATGEALVAVDADPRRGEGMASGDVVNTAARLQTAAPVDGILIGAATHRLGGRSFACSRAEPVAAKGKAEPVEAWVVHVRAGDARGGEGDERAEAAFVGRAGELALVLDALARAVADAAATTVTLVGVPGIGKSRLLAEARRRAHADGPPVPWLVGRTRPYGGAPFAALADVVRERAGIAPSDAVSAAREKLAATVRGLDLASAEEEAWLLGHLRPLVGLGAGDEWTADARAEAFAAWRRFLAAASADGAVVELEDLHWADDALLDFVEDLADRVGDVPLLVLCTARPELLARRRGWGGGRASSVVTLEPLADADTARLLADLVMQRALADATLEAVLARSHGNPLYAQEFARMLGESGETAGAAVAAGTAALPLPQSIQAITAARIDTLAADEKRLLYAGAILGESFTVEPVAALVDRGRWAVEDRLHSLERKELIRRRRGGAEYAFEHELIREVAYGQMVRSERALGHRRAAEWLESRPGGPDADAEAIAHHYQSALRYALAAGPAPEDLAVRTRDACVRAADRALAVNAFGRAVSLYTAALDAHPPEADARASILYRLAKARLYAEDVLPPELGEAADALVAVGELEQAADAEAEVGVWLFNHGRYDEGIAHKRRAAALVADVPRSSVRAFAIVALASAHLLPSGWIADGLRLAREARVIAEDIGREDVAALAVTVAGWGRVMADDPGGLGDLAAAVERARPLHAFWSVVAPVNAAAIAFRRGDLVESAALYDEAYAKASVLGAGYFLHTLPRLRAVAAYHRGDWDDAVRIADDLLDGAATRVERAWHGEVQVVRGNVRLARGDVDGARADADDAMAAARAVGQPYRLVPAAGLQARVLAELGDGGAAEVVRRVLRPDVLREFRLALAGPALVDLAVAAHIGSCGGELAAALAGIRIRSPWADAALALASGSLASAADILASVSPAEAAAARTRAAHAVSR